MVTLLLAVLATCCLYVAGFNATVSLSSSMQDGFDIPLNTSIYTSSYIDSADIHGDGIDDLIMGVVDVNAIYTSVYVLFGNNQSNFFTPELPLQDFVNGKNGFEIRGSTKSGMGQNYFGSQASSGDVDGDGISDIITCDGEANSATGACYVVFGSKNPFPPLIMQNEIIGKIGFSITGSIAEAEMGAYSLAVGDINGDGKADVLIGAPKPYNGSGVVYVLYGSSECRNYPSSAISVSQLNGENGFTVIGSDQPVQFYIGATNGLATGDINNDGLDDLIIGVRSVNYYSGRIYVIYGSSHAFSANFSINSINSNSGFMLNGNGGWLGFSVAAGDVNGDGIDDLIGGAIHATSGDHGSVYVLYGGKNIPFTVNVTSLDGNNGFAVQPVSSDAGFGWYEVTPDLNGDGINDLCIGAPLETDASVSYPGMVYVVYGQKGNAMPALVDLAETPLDGENGFRAIGTIRLGSVGNGLASGDINGDGLDDLMITSNQNIYTIFGTTM